MRNKLPDERRDFKGIWIPKEIWLNPDLTPIEKLFIVEIDSLDNDPKKGCFASNEYFGNFFGIAEGTAANIISDLKKREFLFQVFFDGRHRGLRVHQNVKAGFTKKGTSVHENVKAGFTKKGKQVARKREPNNTVSNPSNNTVREENTPARAENFDNLEEEKSPLPPKVALKGSAPARPIQEASPAPTHIVKTTGPETPGIIEAEGITLKPATALTYDQYPNPKNSQELKEAMRNYFVANPREWQDGVLEQSRATNWTPEKIGDCMTAFCAHQEAENNLKRTYGQYKGMLVKWFLAQPSFDRVKPGPAIQKPYSQPADQPSPKHYMPSYS